MLRLAVNKIDRSVSILAPSIVGRVIVGQLHGHMVTVVSNLVIQLTPLRVHAVEPLQSPVDLVHDVRNVVAARCAVSLIVVSKG